MKERLSVLALAVGALALFYILFLPHPRQGQDDIGLPVSTDVRPEGYQAVWHWLKDQRIPVVSLHNRYDHLPGLLHQPTGNVLILTMPQRLPARGPELDDLAQWVDNGNTLLVMAALTDAPLWSIGGDPLFNEHLERITGLRFETPKSTHADLNTRFTTHFDIRPYGPHPLTAGVHKLVALSALPMRRAALNAEIEAVPLQLAVRTDNGDTVLWLTQREAGQVIVSAAAGLFANGTVLQADNAQLLANILSWSLAPGGAVIFDDAHQGLTDIYGARKFFADPRLHQTLGWIVLLWLVFVLGSQPLRVTQTSWQPTDETAYLQASARYLAAVVSTGPAAQRLIENFLNRITPPPATQSVASGFEALDAHAGIPHDERTLLRGLYTRGCAGRRVNLVRLQNLLSRLGRNFE